MKPPFVDFRNGSPYEKVTVPKLSVSTDKSNQQG
jgi:hypothetical protein